MKSDEFAKTADIICLDKRFSVLLCRFIDENPETILLLEKEEERIKEKLFRNVDIYNAFLKENFDNHLHALLNLYFAVVLAGQCKSKYHGSRW